MKKGCRGGYISIANFDQYQHYKHRNPPWIKLYFALLDDYEFMSLPVDSRWLAVCLILLASQTGNQIPHDPEWLQSRLRLESPPNLGPLFASEFILLDGCKHDASALLAFRKQNADSEKSREEQSRDLLARGKREG